MTGSRYFDGNKVILLVWLPSRQLVPMCGDYRRGADQFLADVRDRGDIDHIIKTVQEKRARGFF
jgi:hypothetical protein